MSGHDDRDEPSSSIGAALRELRRSAGLTGSALARRGRWSQPKVSRIETGVVLPTEDDVRRWISVTGTAPDRFDELWRLRTDPPANAATNGATNGATEQPRDSWVDRYQRRVHLDQQRGGFRAFNPTWIGPILSTRDFLRESLEESADPTAHPAADDDVDPVEVATTLRVMHQDMLYSPGPTVQVVLGEAALYCRPGAAHTMLGQLDRLLDLLALPGLDLRVLAFDEPYPAPSSTAFVVYDDGVLISLLTGDVWSTDPEEVAQHAALMDELSARSEVGDGVRAIVERARHWYASQVEQSDAWGASPDRRSMRQVS